jgi:hypothetical protein
MMQHIAQGNLDLEFCHPGIKLGPAKRTVVSFFGRPAAA